MKIIFTQFLTARLCFHCLNWQFVVSVTKEHETIQTHDTLVTIIQKVNVVVLFLPIGNFHDTNSERINQQSKLMSVSAVVSFGVRRTNCVSDFWYGSYMENNLIMTAIDASELFTWSIPHNLEDRQHRILPA